LLKKARLVSGPDFLICSTSAQQQQQQQYLQQARQPNCTQNDAGDSEVFLALTSPFLVPSNQS
jgi:hypothetical protein